MGQNHSHRKNHQRYAFEEETKQNANTDQPRIYMNEAANYPSRSSSYGCWSASLPRRLLPTHRLQHQQRSEPSTATNVSLSKVVPEPVTSLDDRICSEQPMTTQEDACVGVPEHKGESSPSTTTATGLPSPASSACRTRASSLVYPYGGQPPPTENQQEVPLSSSEAAARDRAAADGSFELKAISHMLTDEGKLDSPLLVVSLVPYANTHRKEGVKKFMIFRTDSTPSVK